MVTPNARAVLVEGQPSRRKLLVLAMNFKVQIHLTNRGNTAGLAEWGGRI